MGREKTMFLLAIGLPAVAAILARTADWSDAALYIAALVTIIVLAVTYFSYEIGDQVRARLNRSEPR